MHITEGDLDHADVVALLAHHFETSLAVTPPGSAHALDLDGLKDPSICFYALWEGETLLAIGALRQIEPGHGEIKSMHTVEAMRGRGVASIMLRHILGEARAKRMKRLSLETGSFGYFEPARRLYLKHGFSERGPYGNYREDPNSTYMTLELASPAS